MSSKNRVYNKKSASKQQESPKPEIKGTKELGQQAHLAIIIQRARLDPDSLTSSDVLQLQRMLGNKAISTLGIIANGQDHSTVQREPTAEEDNIQTELLDRPAVQLHPSHAEEEEVQTKLFIQREASEEEDNIQTKPLAQPAIQLHPSHAEEEEVQTKPIKGALVPTKQIQHQLVQHQTQHPYVVQRGLIRWAKRRWKGKAGRERELSQKYGIRIGPDPNDPNGVHFGHAVLNKLEKVLGRIPIQHLRGTYLTSFERGGGIGSASAYTKDTGTSGHIGIVHPDLPWGKPMPGWLYTMLSKGVGWQRQLMDEGAISSLAEDVTAQGDQELGLANNQRQVMAGISDVLARGNLVEWTIRHEMGHAVDHKIKWTEKRAKLPQFGGWNQYDETNPADMNEIATVFLAKAGIDYPNRAVRLNAFQDLTVTPLQAFVKIMQKGEDADRPGTVTRRELLAHDADFQTKWDRAVQIAKIAKSQPWMFPDGRAQDIAHNGRAYHMDHYDTWVSYLVDARTNHGLSNYQFSSPGEWFAEAYAAYYDPKPNSAARNRLPDAARNWFQKNLGAPPQPGQQQAPAAPALADDITDEMQELADLGPELLAELQGGNQADIGNVPEDLKQDNATRLGGF